MTPHFRSLLNGGSIKNILKLFYQAFLNVCFWQGGARGERMEFEIRTIGNDEQKIKKGEVVQNGKKKQMLVSQKNTY